MKTGSDLTTDCTRKDNLLDLLTLQYFPDRHYRKHYRTENFIRPEKEIIPRYKLSVEQQIITTPSRVKYIKHPQRIPISLNKFQKKTFARKKITSLLDTKDNKRPKPLAHNAASETWIDDKQTKLCNGQKTETGTGDSTWPRPKTSQKVHPFATN